MIRKGELITLNGEVLERIHDRLSFQQWQDRFKELQIISSFSHEGSASHRPVWGFGVLTKSIRHNS